MYEADIQAIVEKQRAFFRSGATQDIELRLDYLRRLRTAMQIYEPSLCKALKADLGKSNFESYMCELGMCRSEASYMIRNLPRFARDVTVPTPLAQFHSHSFRKASPYGVTLIMSPWNYPVLLTLEPLIDAIAAGNTVVLKPSAYSPRTSSVLEKMIQAIFPDKYVAVITGGREENQALLRAHFDFIFFTGSQTVGREVMRHASEYLTPVILELGGKSPCIVERSADLKLTARRIVFGKYLNCGQTCVAPDYILCDAAVEDELVEQLRRQIRKQYGSQPLLNPAYGKIVNEKHFDRLLGLMDGAEIAHGGQARRETLQIEPTILRHVTWDDPVMQEEIFGPILPVLTYENLNQVLSEIESRPHPLAFYIFTRNKALAKRAISKVGFGGGCINDVIIHLATSAMPFGGFGESGMGCYHGKSGFDAFTHWKSIVDKKTWLDLPMRYQPYREIYDRMIRIFMH